jgi:hypothetical protein
VPSRWDLLLDRKPVDLQEHLVEEVSKLLAADLDGWPLPIQELDLETGRRFSGLVTGEVPRPAEAVFTESFRLARWELEREVAAVDDYMRNERWAQAGLAPADKPALLFISRWLTEQLLSLSEATEGRVKRPRLVDCLDRIRRRALTR